MIKYILSGLLSIVFISVFSQTPSLQKAYNQIPVVYSNIVPDSSGDLYFDNGKLTEKQTFYTLYNIRIQPKGTEKGILFDFNNRDFYGTIYYGLFPKELPVYPELVFFKKSSKIRDGKAEINISDLKEKYDIAGWEETGKAMLGYRIVNSSGRIIYDGRIRVKGKGPFNVDLSIIEGPFVNRVTDNEVYISFITNKPCNPYVEVNGHEYHSVSRMGNPLGDVVHEIKIDHLKPDSSYAYSVHFGENVETYQFKTAPKPGDKQPFVFAYTSDSRAGAGGGERDIYGTNGYIMKKMAVVALANNAAFFQFTGDMINGYSSNIGETNLEYANWKRNLEPFWHYVPFYAGMGNHEVVVTNFNDGSKYGVSVDKFPFSNKSGEKIFADNFVNPDNGPVSEDGAIYDPQPDKTNFPPYKETVYYYTYGNVAMIVLNSNYWYSVNANKIPEIGGNPHGYIMDNQLAWLEQTIEKLNKDPDIDHIFVTLHTPAFPNGGHAENDMWYNGNNNIRPTVAGEPVKKGIIQRRDEFLDILINKSEKVVALLAGDEHNYSRMKITKKTVIYPENYHGKKLKISRPLWQITNGSAGAPYYGQQQLPWSSSVEMFSTQYALTLFYINGDKIRLKVINPDTMELIEDIDLIK
ncbi:MAG: hypothetical protein GXO86_12030 [Chlorobi bacterium]|nr:hypothetical protein [Chlorobiota bacterium]